MQQFEFDLMALWNMYINSFPPDDERFLEAYDVVLTDDGTLGQLIKEMKHKELEAVKSLYKCQGAAPHVCMLCIAWIYSISMNVLCRAE